MADPTDVPGVVSSSGILPTLFGGGGAPASLEEIKRRRAIAAALATRQKGYPKTFGEGLTYLGESVGDVLAERRLAEKEAAFEKGYASDPLVRSPGAGGRPVATESVAPDAAPTVALPGSTAELSPEADAQRNQLAWLLSPEGVAQQNPMSGAPRVPLGSQLASLNPAGTMSDAPPVMPRMPSPMPPAPLGAMPEPPNPPTPTDITPMPTMVAQAGGGAPVVPGGAAGPPAPPPPPVAPAGAPVASPTAAAEYVMPKPVKPVAPQMDTRPTEEELRGMALAQKYPGYERAQQQAGYLIGFGKTRREEEYKRRVKQYDSDLTHFNQLDSKYQEWLAGKEQRALQRQLTESQIAQHQLTQRKAAEEEETRKQWGNLPTFVQKDLMEGRETAKASVGSLEALRNARETLDAGTVVGTGAQAKLLYYKARELAGDKEAARIVGNTQSFQASLGPAVMAAIKSYSGAQVSNADREYAAAMVGSDISLSEAAIRRIIDIGERSAKAAISEHRERLDRDLKGNDHLRRFFDVPDPKGALPVDRGGGGGSSGGSVVDVGSEADAMKLPVGTKFKLPSGRTGTVR